ncbi:DUF1636 family protein [Methylobacterium isbiliense]|jgi:predicted metal-binding protein|uniref:Metal-binding protein n=1 Tax=Methylobacterium isbiliense TaxID=315478 RepID=A0ABQ4SEF7_9HYPH|nr:DUF1636 domain-containing protein [Methylobacterium isbiliense]MDN3626904.1 DUF1636 domain-containing protein [Methylobacterium isbiliense]GJE00198.1 hypothetical protein GMJLKIPL_2116 [Methylobacterium isbiliense]
MSLTLYVCTTCRAATDDPDGPRAGARLLDALTAALAERDTPVAVEAVECLSVCKRPCTVAVASPGRWTYVYGDLDPASAADTILDGISRYAATPDGLVPWRERPDAFRKGVVARIPPAPVRSA